MEQFIVLRDKLLKGASCSFSHNFFKGSGSCIIIIKKLKQCTQPLAPHGHLNITPLFSFPFVSSLQLTTGRPGASQQKAAMCLQNRCVHSLGSARRGAQPSNMNCEKVLHYADFTPFIQ